MQTLIAFKMMIIILLKNKKTTTTKIKKKKKNLKMTASRKVKAGIKLFVAEARVGELKLTPVYTQICIKVILQISSKFLNSSQ